MKYLRRIVMFFASRLFVICLILGLIVYLLNKRAFYYN